MARDVPPSVRHQQLAASSQAPSTPLCEHHTHAGSVSSKPIAPPGQPREYIVCFHPLHGAPPCASHVRVPS